MNRLLKIEVQFDIMYVCMYIEMYRCILLSLSNLHNIAESLFCFTLHLHMYIEKTYDNESILYL